MKWIEEAQRIYDGPAWQPLLYLGRTACSAGDLSAALDYFDKGLDLSTGNWELLYGKGMCVYQRIGNVGAAQRYLEQAAATDQGQPGIQSVSLQLGGLYEQLGRIQPAIDAYRRVLELDPENATAKQKLSVLEQR
jgi:tetratricopeptide (TPR) repeat protein